MTKLRTESHQGRPIEFSIDENGRLGIEFDDYACSYRYMSEAKARELRDWLNHVLPDEPTGDVTVAQLVQAWDSYCFAPVESDDEDARNDASRAVFDRARSQLNRTGDA